jgi:outer membrane lipoprotein LolB
MQKTPTLSTPVSVQKEMASQLTQWRMQGKIAIRDQHQAHSARLQWAQHQQNFDLLVTGPLGQGSLAIQSDGQITTVATSRGSEQIQGDLSAYIAKNYGWTLPLDSLKYWIRGLADPSSPSSEETDVSGLPKTIQQAGWTITYDGFRAAKNMAIVLPAHLVIVREDYQLKIIIQDWSDLVIDKSG